MIGAYSKWEYDVPLLKAHVGGREKYNQKSNIGRKCDYHSHLDFDRVRVKRKKNN